MTTTFTIWAVSGAVLLVGASVLGRYAAHRGWTGFLIDSRGRYSLTQFQLYLWTFIIVSLLSAFFFGRLLLGGTSNPIDFGIPTSVWALLGISAGSTVTSITVKSQKDLSDPASVAASSPDDPPRFSQIFLVEEGVMADQVIDVTKFQNFVFTLILAAAYIAISISLVQTIKNGSDLTSLPDLSQGFLVILGISHAGYIGGKLPTKAGPAAGLTMQRVLSPQGPPAAAAAAGQRFAATDAGAAPGNVWPPLQPRNARRGRLP